MRSKEEAVEWTSRFMKLHRSLWRGWTGEAEVLRVFGPAKGLEVVDALTSERALRGYPQLPAVRGDLLAKLGRLDEARQAFERAAALTRNQRERTLFLDRAAACQGGSSAV